VSIPIGYFVVAPKIGQHILDQTLVAVPNMTQASCVGQASGSADSAWIINDARITIPKLFGLPIQLPTTIESYTQEVYTTACDTKEGMVGGWVCAGTPHENEVLMGTYTSPEMALHMGKENVKKFSPQHGLKANFTVLTAAWVNPVFFGSNPVQKARLILKATDVTVKVMGFLKIKGLSMRNEMTCTGAPMMTGFGNIPNDVCYPHRPHHTPDGGPILLANCESGRHTITPPATTTVAEASSTSNVKTSTTTTIGSTSSQKLNSVAFMAVRV